MTDDLNIENNTDLEGEGIEILEEEIVSPDVILEELDSDETEESEFDDSSELGLGEDPDNDDEVDFDVDEEEYI